MKIDYEKHALKILIGGVLLFILAFLIFGGPRISDLQPIAYIYNRLGKNGCCRICRVGRACGNSCIKRITVCEQPPGCACNQKVPKFEKETK